MIWRFEGNFLAYVMLYSCCFSITFAFNFPDFNLYDESSDTMDKACSVFHSMIESIHFAEPKLENVSFQLRSACERVEYGVAEANVMRNSKHFDTTIKTVVIVTGWNSDLNKTYTEELTKAYLCRGDLNLIVVDTADFIRTEYIKSAYNTEKLGEFIAIGLKNLEIPGKDIHLIGHSLGAHIMGSAGRYFTKITGDRIRRITGLDPARPCFKSDQPVFPRLRVEDATFVDIIHSNPSETGLEEQIGHIDFYPGGLNSQQNGCPLYNVKCSHLRSVYYYTESVFNGNEKNFMAYACNNYTDLQAMHCHGIPQVPMGLAVDENARGIYLLTVNDKMPYGMNSTNDSYLRDKEQCGICKE